MKLHPITHTIRNRTHLRPIIGSGFVRNVGLLASGTVAGQAIMVLILPVLTRIYHPEAFGILGVYMSSLMVLSVAACLRLDLATPLPDSDTEAVHLVIAGILAATILSISIEFAVALNPELFATLLGQRGIERYIWMIPLGAWFTAVYSALQFWSIRKGRYGVVAQTQLVRAIGGAASQTGLGLVGAGPGGLLFGHIIYTGIGSANLTRIFLTRDKNILRTFKWRNMNNALRNHYFFPLYSVPESLLNAATVNIPVIMIASIAGPKEAGFMMLAQRVTSIPIGLLGSSLSRVYLGHAAEKRRQGQLGAFTRMILRNLLKIGVLPFLGIAIVAPLFFPVVFGDTKWQRAGVMVSWMVPYMLLQFAVSPVSTLLHATNKQRTAFVLQGFGTILVLGMTKMADTVMPNMVFEFFAVASFLYYLTYLAVVLRASFLTDKQR